VYRATARRPGGWAVTVDPDLPGGQREADTLTCGHCQRIIFVASDPGGGCYQCQAPVCVACAEAGICLPFEAWLDAMEGAPLRGRWATTFAEWNAKRLGRR